MIYSSTIRTAPVESHNIPVVFWGYQSASPRCLGLFNAVKERHMLNSLVREGMARFEPYYPMPATPNGC